MLSPNPGPHKPSGWQVSSLPSLGPSCQHRRPCPGSHPHQPGEGLWGPDGISGNTSIIQPREARPRNSRSLPKVTTVRWCCSHVGQGAPQSSLQGQRCEGRWSRGGRRALTPPRIEEVLKPGRCRGRGRSPLSRDPDAGLNPRTLGIMT